MGGLKSQTQFACIVRDFTISCPTVANMLTALTKLRSLAGPNLRHFLGLTVAFEISDHRRMTAAALVDPSETASNDVIAARKLVFRRSEKTVISWDSRKTFDISGRWKINDQARLGPPQE